MRRMLRSPPHGVMLLMTRHHTAGGHLFLSVPDAPQNLDIRVFRGNSTGGRAPGGMEVRCRGVVKMDRIKPITPHPLSAPTSALRPPQPCPLAGLTLGPLWIPSDNSLSPPLAPSLPTSAPSSLSHDILSLIPCHLPVSVSPTRRLSSQAGYQASG